ncbi:hypothetical protein L202_00058 [Cryptococcus amylolentus CBS 6039]|uniref:Uncharacterized protein n=1 Tax=Cryptococcus amylolentus CBS 6039 TaxID=1295533 RepID=A0A1E3I670_9TREE|nr:hypothetical protein L202_00058 [Cryptococcus amylolentus CBS 6039]ODN84027.1 hypothetical protein L202_00058 [Cryptococcus amylolentus CBS 6039]
MFLTAKRTFNLLLHTPLVPPPTTATQPIELATISSASSPARLRTRTLSSLSVRGYDPATGTMGLSRMGGQRRGVSTEKGSREELYADEAGKSSASTDEVSHSDAAFNKDANPETAAKGVEQETGKDFTKESPANADESLPLGKKGEKDGEHSMGTSRHPEKR